MRNRPGFVYFISAADRSMVKIGWSKDPQKRRVDLQASSPFDLEILCAAPGTLEDEKALQGRFVEHHRRGEWFRGHESMFALAAAISAAGEIPAEMRGIAGQKNIINNKGRGEKRTERGRLISEGQKAANARRRAAEEVARHRASVAGELRSLQFEPLGHA